MHDAGPNPLPPDPRPRPAVNLTLPAMAGQFLLLMVMLDKLWFSPVGKVLDERDALIRGMLAGVKDSTGNVDAYAQEAQEILRVRERGARGACGALSGTARSSLHPHHAWRVCTGAVCACSMQHAQPGWLRAARS